MKWREMTIGRKIVIGFGVVLTLLGLICLLNFEGVGGIVKNAEMVIAGNRLDADLAQKEVDHLNWAGKVNALLTDDEVQELDVETNDHKCGFGRWLYGEGRKNAEALVPSLAPLLKQIEGPHLKLHESAIQIGKTYVPADEELPGFLAEKETDHLRWVAAIRELFLENRSRLEIETNDHKCSLGRWLYGPKAQEFAREHPEMAQLLESIKQPHHSLHQSAIAIQKTYHPIHPGLLLTLKDRLDDHRRWVASVSSAIIEGRKTVNVETNPTQCAFGRFLNSQKAAKWMKAFPEFREALNATRAPHVALHNSAKQIEKLLKNGRSKEAESVFKRRTQQALSDMVGHFQTAIQAEQRLMDANTAARQIYQKQTLPSLEQVTAVLKNMKQRAGDMVAAVGAARKIYADQTLPALASVQGLLHEIRKEARNNIMTDTVMLAAAQGTRRNVSVIGVIAIIAGILLAFFMARGIVTILERISEQMSEGSQQVASAANQVSASSQSLAEGASEQAAAIEETSSSLEEITSMTKQNADNAEQADGLMKEANDVVTMANQAMDELTTSMADISRASEDTQKIIKTIDEIAFQTNLLALNAAVEAARAGEAGAGFAVVADEVRNLAMRAAEAAKNTAGLIEGTVKKIDDGARLVTRTNEAFGKVTESSVKVGTLVGEIAAASTEQAQGVDQVSRAVMEMDKVVQQNAASAEESASASEELNAQAEQMKLSVGDLVKLVGGRTGSDEQTARSLPRRLSRPEKKKHLVVQSQKQDSAENVFPMDDEDFGGF